MRQVLVLVFLGVLTLGTRAEVALDGYFIAQETCPAFQSFNNQTNPGGITTTPERAYRIVAANKTEASHYLLIVPGVEPERRWVAVGCGIRTVDAGGRIPAGPAEPVEPSEPAGQTQYILAVSWQPAFCEGLPEKPECASQAEDSFEASHFTLHGLWPQPRGNEYCPLTGEAKAEMAGRPWDELPAVDLSAALREELDEVMPGTQSGLERHEWARHGTCYGTGQEEYYADSLAMMRALNQSAVAELFAESVGQSLAIADIDAAFDLAFGEGASDRVVVACKRDGDRRLIVELTIGLTGTINGPDDLAGLILAAAPAPEGTCDAGIVDPVGLQ